MAWPSFGALLIVFLCTRVTTGTKDTISDDELDKLIEASKREVDDISAKTFATVTDKNREHPPGEMHTMFRFPEGEALKLTRDMEKFELAVEKIMHIIHDKHGKRGHDFHLDQFLTPKQLEKLAEVSPCLKPRRKVKCEKQCFHRKYRTIDGSCNNLKHPLWGASMTAQDRFLPPRYEDDIGEPVGWNRDGRYYGYPLPSPRLVSNRLLTAVHVNKDETRTGMVMIWGQFLSHDTNSTPVSSSNAQFSSGRPCNETCTNEPPCFPMKVPPRDPTIPKDACMGFTRSGSVCGSGKTSILGRYGVSHREQINQITSFIDASNVYGSTKDMENKIRDQDSKEGLLREGVPAPNGNFFLPFDTDSLVACKQDHSHNENVPCFLAGDIRANENLALTAIHTIFMRHHNKLAKKLKFLNPHWNGPKVYQETRKIVGAQMQHMSFDHYLPLVLGQAGMRELGTYTGYDATVNPTIANAFSTAAFRFGHATVPPFLDRLNENYEENADDKEFFSDLSFTSHKLIDEGGLDPILRGLHHVRGKKFETGHIFDVGMTSFLFAHAHQIALDLAALNIQRGRDHGLPSYNAFREHCGLQRAYGFNDFKAEIRNETNRQILGELYGHPDNVDLFVGSLTEEPLEGAQVGPTFMCLLVKQLKRLREGDRFWYENPCMFTPEQLAEIKKTTLSGIVCETNDGTLNKIQENIFLKADVKDYKPCSTIEQLDLHAWKEDANEL